MEKYKFNKIVTMKESQLCSGTGLMTLGSEYLLSAGGVLIDREGNVVWNVKWNHSFSEAFYIKNRQILLTNRIINFGMGGDFYLGIACIDMKTGEYKWKHYYNHYESRLSLRIKKPDINKVRGLGTIDLQQNCIVTDGFRVNIEDGSYNYTGESKEKTIEDKSIIHSKHVKSFKEMQHWNTEDTLMLRIRVNIININGQDYSKEGYFFNKCDFIIPTKECIYFWGVPAKRKPGNTILFKYSKVTNKIEEETEMPFRSSVDDMYNFFNKGILILSGETLWLSKDFSL